MSMIRENLERIKTGTARLVAVSKTRPVADIQAAYDWGQLSFGENYVSELLEKAPLLPHDIQWHFIGSLQSNKIKQLVSIDNLFVIETVDSAKKALLLNKALNRKLNIFLQVNTSGELSKSGLQPSDTLSVAKTILDTCPALNLMGLMTIGSPQKSSPNPDFDCLAQLRNQLELSLGLKNLELSMGMSDDYEQALLQGSTSVRIGSAIFGSRN